ncbi:MAG: PSD1 and planctomycete cytochrome C domain-containing protein [Pirellulaceae bacterium]|nr:PSD1 and planctomycete cytochrome C domain-containing protein [Pirellulaceae bacterium]
MINRGLQRACLLAIACGICLVSQAAPPPEDHPALMKKSQRLFTEKVRPFLVANCLRCHGGEKTRSGLNLATRELLLAGGESYDQPVRIGSGSESPLVRLLRHEQEPHMPLQQPRVDDSMIEAISRWIDLGAAYDRPLVEGLAEEKTELQVTSEDRQYWAFQPLDPPPLPRVRRKGWAHTSIDLFLLRRMEKERVLPAPQADRRTMIRRAYFDLVGLPPAVEEVEAFVAAEDLAQAWEKIVDRLLESEHFGERWARHWLDTARFAESHGFEHDTDRNHAYHYRDFVIRAMNQDLPYDQFLRWQLAGDELAPNDSLALAATGFLGAGVFPTQITISEAERVRYDALDDMLSTTGTSMLGLTIGCARCHDHKYDPIPTADYYRLLSAFATTVRSEIEVCTGPVSGTDQAPAVLSQLATLRQQVSGRQQAWQEALAAWVVEQGENSEPLPEIKDEKERQALTSLVVEKRLLGDLDKELQEAAKRWFLREDSLLSEQKAMIEKLLTENRVQTMQVTSEGFKPMRLHTSDGSIPDFYEKVFFLARGDVSQKKGEVSQGFLDVLTRAPNGADRWIVPRPESGDLSRTSHRRSGLAHWITDTEQGAGSLAARVIVNRVWHHHMGRGIVGTINDFGVQGDSPSHPGLLEWMAADLVEHGWRLKRLHKMILLSRAYQLSHQATASSLKRDPTNELLGHFNRRRMEAEVIRDNLLAVGGILDTTMYGPGTLDASMRRRSIYFKVKRSQLVPFLRVFDWPDSLTSLGVRPTTTVSPQALIFMNNPQVHACAEGLADVVRPRLKESFPAAVREAYLRAYGRAPSEQDLQDGIGYLEDHADQTGQALVDYCLVLLSTNEFVYIP